MAYELEWNGKKYSVDLRVVNVNEFFKAQGSDGSLDENLEALKKLVPELPIEELQIWELGKINRQIAELITRAVKDAKERD